MSEVIKDAIKALEADAPVKFRRYSSVVTDIIESGLDPEEKKFWRKEASYAYDKSHPYYGEVNSLVFQLRKAGCKLVAVHDGEERNNVSSRQEAVNHILSVDFSTLIIRVPGQPKDSKNHVISIVLGNEPGIAPSDYSIHPLLDRITDEHYKRWEGHTLKYA
jgi:hypothetical protein